MLVDGELQPSAAAAPRLPEKNLPPPDPKYDGTGYWGRYAQTVQQWLVACNTPPALWGVRALVCLSGEASDYLHQQLQEDNMSYLQVVSNPELLTWQQLDQYMTSGNFGSPPTDDSVRDKLASFKQRKVAGQWNTPRHLSKMLAIIQQAPTRPDDKSLIWFVKGSLHPALRERMQLTPDNKPWSSFPAFCTALREVGAAMDRELNQQQQQGQPAGKLPQQGFGAAASKQAGRSGGASSSKPGAAAPYNSGAPAVGGGGSGGKQQHGSSSALRYAPYGASPRQQGFSPHAGKSCFNAAISPAEAKRRKDANLCFFCGNVDWRAPAKEHKPSCPKRKLSKDKVDVSGLELGGEAVCENSNSSGVLLQPNLLSPSPAVNLSPTGGASLLALTQQGVSDAELIDVAIADAEAQYAAMLLSQQDQRCAAHTAQLRAEGWFDPPSLQPTTVIAATAQGVSPIAERSAAVHTETQQHSDSLFSVVPSELQLIQYLTGRDFSLDAAVFPAGISSPAASQCCSEQEPFVTKDLAGHHVWVCVSFADLKDHVDHYIQQKRKDPQHTSACFVVPKWRVLPHPALSGMQIIKEYRQGYHLFLRGKKRVSGLSDPVLVITTHPLLPSQTALYHSWYCSTSAMYMVVKPQHCLTQVHKVFVMLTAVFCGRITSNTLRQRSQACNTLMVLLNQYVVV
jgi:hypothetical protein